VFTEMFSSLFSYDPATLPAEQREAMAGILKARSEMLAAQAEVTSIRAQAWGGTPAAADLAELKAQELAKLRQAWIEQVRPFLKDAVDVENLMELVPAVVAGVLQSFKIPLPIILESLGVDVDAIKLAADGLKELLEDL